MSTRQLFFLFTKNAAVNFNSDPNPDLKLIPDPDPNRSQNVNIAGLYSLNCNSLHCTLYTLHRCAEQGVEHKKSYFTSHVEIQI
jgi:hypothetical protein